MKAITMRQRLLASSMICGAAIAALATTPASAQDAETEVSEFVVTGSRIPQPNLTSISPVQVVGEQEVSLGGRPATADILNQLPQVSQNTQTGLGSTSNPLSTPGGVSTVDLRGLGPQRTLTLVDGRRLGFGDPNTGNPNPGADINQIPSQLIDRIEVLTGGASATYGSDAIAGVVNFVMKRNFEGLQIDGQWGAYQHNQHNEYMQGLLQDAGIAKPKKDVFDGKVRDLSIIFGANAPDDRGNVTAYFTYHDQDPVVQKARDFSACQFATDGPDAFCAGSPNSNYVNPEGSDAEFRVSGNTFIPWDSATVTSPPALFNSNDYAYLLQQSTRYTAGFFANYDVNENINLYSDFGFMNDKTNVLIAPSGLFIGSGAQGAAFAVNCSNPFLSAQQQGAIGCTSPTDQINLLLGRRNIEGGGRNQFYDHTNYRVVLGAKGDIAGPWSYDVNGSYYYTSLFSSAENYLTIAGVQDALLVGGTAANPVCLSGNAGCVPYNIFQEGGVSQAAASSLLRNGSARGTITERIYEININGDLGEYGVKTPWADDGLGVAFGVQNRRDKLTYEPDSGQLSGDLSGFGGASTAIDESIGVTEYYIEGRLPLAQGRPWMEELTLDAGYRYSDYTLDIETDTYKVGLQWAPTTDIRFRGSFQKAVRAPNILELFTPVSVTNSAQLDLDPCSPASATSPATASLAQCLAQGVTAAQYGDGTRAGGNSIVQCPSNQCSVLTGGNEDLQPEEAKTYSFGFTFTPSFVRGLTASLDYYHIKLEDQVGAIPINITMNKCLAGDAASCALIQRNPTNGSLVGNLVQDLGYIQGFNVNIGAVETSGIDLQANYNLPLENWGWDKYGQVSVNFAGSYLLDNKITPVPGEGTYDCAGLFGPGCQTLLPEWRHTARINWTTPWNVTASLAWRYIGKVTFEEDTSEDIIGQGTTHAFNHELPSRSYVDLAAIWQINDMFKVRGGVNNIFDQDPPLVDSGIVGTGLPNSYPTYDLLGRKFFMGFTASF